jgi:3-oxoacyl-[acyl-carrier-protein] synthase II
VAGNGHLDATGRPVVVVTGMGVVTALGQGKEDNWKKLTAGTSGIHAIKRFSTDGLKTRIAGTVDYLFDRPVLSSELSHAFAQRAAAEAIAESGIGAKGTFPGPLFCAVPPVEIQWQFWRTLAEKCDPDKPVTVGDLIRVTAEEKRSEWHRNFLFGTVAQLIAEEFGTQGLPVSLSTACASGATAIQLGLEAIRRGETEAALCIGTDGSVHTEALIRFSLLSALSTQNDPPEGASKPFSKNRDGFVMAEGAGALVLESLEHAKARGAKILGIVAGCGEMADSFHRTRSNPDGKPIIGCMKRALADAGVGPADVDYINAHGTGTPENDRMEYLGVAAVFGDRAKEVPISSNKSMIGHTLSAAGAIEAIASLLTIARNRIPPTINYKIPDPAIPLDVVPNTARDAKVRRAISNSFGFGGQNVCLVLAGEPA